MTESASISFGPLALTVIAEHPPGLDPKRFQELLGRSLAITAPKLIGELCAELVPGADDVHALSRLASAREALPVMLRAYAGAVRRGHPAGGEEGGEA